MGLIQRKDKQFLSLQLHSVSVDFEREDSVVIRREVASLGEGIPTLPGRVAVPLTRSIFNAFVARSADDYRLKCCPRLVLCLGDCSHVVSPIRFKGF